ncbi:MAG: polysaccharide deacetylase family protein [Ruminococcus sp.]|nr:polysaccharide deacetylase family protein [Ruminococcus sp.]
MNARNLVKDKSFIAVIMTVLLLILVFAVSRSSADGADLSPEKDDSYRNIPILMYHSILPDTERQGDYVISPSLLESDMVWLKEHGYTAVAAGQVIDFCLNGGELPEKPVILTFDDGQLNNLTYVLPLLIKYDMCGVFSVVGRYTEAACEEAEPSDLYSYMDLHDIVTLTQTGIAEIANHSYDLHGLGERRGSLQLGSESFEEYRRLFFNDTFKVQEMIKEATGITPQVYTYPFGLTCAASRTLVKVCGFKASLGAEEKISRIIRGDGSSLYELGRFNRPAGISTEQFMNGILSR